MRIARSPLRLILAVLLVAPAAAPAAQVVDRLAAVVNDEVITLSELNEKLAQAVRQLRQRSQGRRLPPRDVLRQQLLDRMIDEKLQVQKAEERGLQVADEEVDRAVRRMARQNNLSVARFRQVLQQRGIDYGTYREQIRKRLLRQRLQNRMVRAKIQITDQEVESYLQRQGEAGNRNEHKLQHILVAVPEEASPDQVDKLRSEARKLRQRIQEGAAFGQVAAAESDGQKALEGGDLGWMKPGALPPAVQSEMEALDDGQLSRVVRTPSGFHLFKLQDRRPLQSAEEVQIRARQILIRTDSGRTKRQARQQAQELLERAQNGASFAKLAREYSEGPAAEDGGDLGWLSHGAMAPSFDELAFSLTAGETGGPVATDTGIHIIKVLERRDREVDPENQRKQARQALRKRQTKQRLDQFLRQLRAQAYIDIRL